MKPKIIISTLIAATLFLLYPGRSQVFEAGNQISIAVNGRCVSQSSDIINYSYSLRSLSGSIQLVWAFDPLTKCPGDSILSALSIPGWFGPHRFASKKTPNETNIYWQFDSDTSAGGIPPGGNEDRFGFSSRYLPGIGNYYAEGYHPLPSFPEGMAEDSIPGYDDLTPYGPGVVGHTIVPVLPGKGVSSFTLLDSLDSYVIQSRNLGWITTEPFASKYAGFLGRARSAIVSFLDPRSASRVLDSLLAAIPTDSLQGALSTDACALLRFNVVCVKSKLLPQRQVAVGTKSLANSHIQITVRPSTTYTADTLLRSVATLRWKTGLGYSLGTVTSSPFGFTKVGDTLNLSGYTYQKFESNSVNVVNWQAGQEYVLFEVSINDPVGVSRFELTNSLTGGEWFVDIDYLDKTDSLFYQPTAQGFAFQNKSTTTGGTAYSGERHATIHGTKFHEVFESGGEIVYRRKDLNSASWDTTTRISAGNGSNSDASIVVAHDGSVHVVWQRQLNANAFALWYNKSTDGGFTWGTPFRPVTAESIAIIQQNQWNIYPLLAELGSTQLVAVVCSSVGPRYMKSTNLGTSWSTLTTITGVSNPSYVWHPSLAPATNYLILSYDNRYYGLYTKKYDGTNWLGELSVTGGVGTIYDRFSSIAVDGYRMPQIAWCAQRSGSGDYRIIYKPGVVDATSWPSYYVEFSHQTGISDLYPSISTQTRYGITWRIDVLYPNSANQVWLRQQTAYTWGSPSQVSSSGQWATTTLQEYGSALYDDVRLWTDQSGSSPYEIKRTSDAGYQLQSLSGPTLATELHRRVTIESPTNRSFISYEVGPLKVVTAAGDTTTLPFKAIDKSKPLAATVDNAWDYLGTDSVSLPTNARYLLVNAEIQNVVRDDSTGGTGTPAFLGRAFRVDVQGARKAATAYTDPQGSSGAKVIAISTWAGQRAMIRPTGMTSVQGAVQPVVGIGDIYVRR